MKLKKIKESIDQKIELNEKAAFLEEVAKFNEYGRAIYIALKELNKLVRQLTK